MQCPEQLNKEYMTPDQKIVCNGKLFATAYIRNGVSTATLYSNPGVSIDLTIISGDTAYFAE